MNALNRDVVHTHWDMYRTMEEQFKLIFPGARLESMLARLNDLRMNSSEWVDGPGLSDCVRAPGIADEFDRVAELANRVQCFVYLGKIVPDEDPTVFAFHKKNYHDLQMILYRHARLHRKRTRPLSLALFTPGTVFESQVRHVDKETKINSVKCVTSSELGYGLITVAEPHMEPGSRYGNPFPTTGYRMLNTSHVTRVIKHVPDKRRVTEAARTVEHKGVSRIGKSRRTYSAAGDLFLVAAELQHLGIMLDSTQAMDFQTMRASAYANCPGVKHWEHESNWRGSLIVVRKKKWKRWIRQNMNRFLISRSVQEQRERAYQKQMDAEYEKDINWD